MKQAFRKNRRDGMVFGVFAGMAYHFGFDVLWTRVAFVALTLLGFGLPLREFDLLANLARVPDRPLSRDALLRAVWRIDFDPGTNRVEVPMSRLRSQVARG